MNGCNFLDNNNDPRPDVNGIDENQIEQGIFHHGTIVAGIIGAKGDNGRDGAGINWHAKLMNIKVLGNSGEGSIAPLVEAIHYAVDNGASVINISMVGGEKEEEMRDAMKYAYTNGVVMVAAAGNDIDNLNITPLYPICLDSQEMVENILGVSAMDEDHHLAGFSNIGSDCIDITAPGVDIQSTLRYSPTNNLADAYSIDTAWNGTSFAAPFISGAAALIKSVQPSWGPTEIFDAIFATVHHTPSDDEDLYANLFGAGLLQIDKAVQYAQDQKDDNKITEIDTTEIEDIDETTFIHSELYTQLMFVAPRTGEYEKKSYGKEQTTILRRATFFHMQDIDNFVNSSGEQQFVALRTESGGVNNVYIYRSDMRLVDEWTFEKTGIYDIAAGDISGDGIPELIFASQNQNTVYMYVYSINGTYLATLERIVGHEGAVVDMVYDEDRGVNDIVIMYIRDGHTYIERLDNTFGILNYFILDTILGGEIVVFDIDSDGEDEYVVGAAPGRQPFVYIIDQEGQEEYRFRGYPPYMKSGMDITYFDYGGNGTLDVILTPRDGGTPVRVMSPTGEVLEAWWPLGSEDIGRVFALGL